MPTGIDFGTIFEAKSSSIEEKRGSKNRSKKGCPPRRKRVTITRPGGSWRRASRAHFQQQKQLFGQQQQQLQQQLQKQLLELMFCSKLLFGSVFEIIVRSRFQELFELLHLLEQDHSARYLTRPGQRPGEFWLTAGPAIVLQTLRSTVE